MGTATQLILTQAKEQTASSPFARGKENLQEELTDCGSRGEGHVVILSDWLRQGSAHSSPGPDADCGQPVSHEWFLHF